MGRQHDIGVCVFLALFGMGFVGTEAVAEGVSMQASVGFDGFVRGDRWNPIVVFIDNTGPELTGIVSITTRPAPTFAAGEVTYTVQRPVRLVAGGRAILRTSIPVGRTIYPVVIQLESEDSRTLTTSVQGVPVAENVLLMRRSRDGPPPWQEAGQAVWTAPGPEFLPGDRWGYEPLDVLILTPRELAILTVMQRNAVESWVGHGGELRYRGPISDLKQIFPALFQHPPSAGVVLPESALPLPVRDTLLRETAPVWTSHATTAERYESSGVTDETYGFPSRWIIMMIMALALGTRMLLAAGAQPQRAVFLWPLFLDGILVFVLFLVTRLVFAPPPHTIVEVQRVTSDGSTVSAFLIDSIESVVTAPSRITTYVPANDGLLVPGPESLVVWEEGSIRSVVSHLAAWRSRTITAVTTVTSPLTVRQRESGLAVTNNAVVPVLDALVFLGDRSGFVGTIDPGDTRVITGNELTNKPNGGTGFAPPYRLLREIRAEQVRRGFLGSRVVAFLPPFETPVGTDPPPHSRAAYAIIDSGGHK